jgi:hypothetical protein
VIEVADKELGCETGWNSQVLLKCTTKLSIFHETFDPHLAVVAFRPRSLHDICTFAYLAAGFSQHAIETLTLNECVNLHQMSVQPFVGGPSGKSETSTFIVSL